MKISYRNYPVLKLLRDKCFYTANETDAKHINYPLIKSAIHWAIDMFSSIETDIINVSSSFENASIEAGQKMLDLSKLERDNKQIDINECVIIGDNVSFDKTGTLLAYAFFLLIILYIQWVTGSVLFMILILIKTRRG